MLTAAPAKDSSPDDYLQLILGQHRGRLRLYLGACPGVGKTYQMLAKGNRLRKCGVDVVIGYMEFHDQRPETTAQIKEVEMIPPRLVQYRGTTLKEMDVDAVLARKPMVALVDELAHTNAPGSKKGKRYEEVQELLNAGINVISTVNIEHLESMNAIVERTTGIHVRECVPDEVFMSADQVATVDLPSKELLRRLKAGKIYPPERVELALGNFFNEKTLKRLRDMTLSKTAHYLGHKQREASALGDVKYSVGQVAVALGSRCPDPGMLLREAMRLAAQFNAPWHVVHVHTPQEAPSKISSDVQQRIAEALELSQRMGGNAVVLKSEEVGPALISFAREYSIAHLVMGHPEKTHLSHWRFRPSLIEALTRELADVNFVIV
jgi:two-component system, OmpR family, sensor histidine kinase KdpD